MNLDSRSIIIVIVLGTTFMATGLLGVTRGYLGEVPGSSRWAWATLIQAIGWTLAAAFRGVVPELLSVVGGHTLIQLSFIQYLLVIHDFRDERPRAFWLYAAIAAEGAVLAYFTAISSDLPARLIVISACVGAVSLRCAYLLGTGVRPRPASHTFTATLFLIAGTFMAGRGAIAAVWWHAPEPHLVSLLNELSYLVFYLLAATLTFGFVLMCSDRYIERRKDAEEALRRSSLLDDLTQLPNRAVVSDRLRQLFEQSTRRPDFAYAALFIDLDNFKFVNDSLGHDAGDQLLVETAARLTSVLRQGDTMMPAHEAMAGRFGGDEFVIVLNGLPDSGQARRVAERILAAMAAPFRLAGQTVSVQCSIGVSTSGQHFGSIEDLLSAADTAMYQAKASGKGNYVVFDESMQVQARQRLNLEVDLRAAIQSGQISAVYQPIVDLASGRVAALEALARWEHPERGTIPLSEFLSIAEETGLIVQIGQLVMEDAAATLERLNGVPGGSELAMNVFMSPRQLVDARFRAAVESIVSRLTVAPERLRFAISESAVSRSTTMVRDALEEFRALGVHIHLADFGAGLSSLGLLRTLPIDGLTIDQSFIDAADGDVQAIAILNAIIALGHNLGKTITVDGISDRAQIATVLAVECDMARGSLFGPPMTAADATASITADYSTFCIAA